MNYKIITLEDLDTQILIKRDRDENDGTETVSVEAFFVDADGNEYIFQESIRFDNNNLPESFVRDFSEESAREFLERGIENQGLDS